LPRETRRHETSEEFVGPPSAGLRGSIGQAALEARRRRGWSIRGLSERSGVSKGLISRIERGEANPSVETLWRLVGALEVPFSDLVRYDPPAVTVVRSHEAVDMKTEDDAMQIRLLFASSGVNRLEVYELLMPPASRSEWQSHGRGTNEHSIVLSGSVVVEVDDREYQLGHGDLIGFSADRSHTYRSLAQPVTMLCVMTYGDSVEQSRGSRRR
jgi:transcriptional regulator with XRE-family HTH domain